MCFVQRDCSREVLASGIVLCRLLGGLRDFHSGGALYVVVLVFGVAFGGLTSCVSVLTKL